MVGRVYRVLVEQRGGIGGGWEDEGEGEGGTTN